MKCSGNWMWPAKLAGEGAVMYDACKSMCDVMKDLGIGVDGGEYLCISIHGILAENDWLEKEFEEFVVVTDQACWN